MKLHSMKLIFGSVNFANGVAGKRSEGSYGWKVAKTPVQPGYVVTIDDPLNNSIEPVVTVTPFDPITSASVSSVSSNGFTVTLKSSTSTDANGEFGFVFIQNDS